MGFYTLLSEHSALLHGGHLAEDAVVSSQGRCHQKLLPLRCVDERLQIYRVYMGLHPSSQAHLLIRSRLVENSAAIGIHCELVDVVQHDSGLGPLTVSLLRPVVSTRVCDP